MTVARPRRYRERFRFRRANASEKAAPANTSERRDRASFLQAMMDRTASAPVSLFLFHFVGVKKMALSPRFARWVPGRHPDSNGFLCRVSLVSE
jgi:hypothetical protein